MSEAPDREPEANGSRKPQAPATSAASPAAPRAARLSAPLLVVLGMLLAIEAMGGIVIFFARLVAGRTPGETLHVIAGALLVLAYAIYQWQHWSRVSPWRSRLDYALGLIAALSMAAALGTGLWLAAPWWQARVVASSPYPVPYPTSVSAAHNIMSMLVLTFVAAHLAAVLLRDAAAGRRQG